MMSKETGEMRPATEEEIQLEKAKEFGEGVLSAKAEIQKKNFIMFEVGEEIEVKGHKFRLKHIDIKHNTLVLVSKELKRQL